MQRHARFTFFCASILLAYPALAGDALDAMFDKESGPSVKVQSAQAAKEPKASSLDAMFDQETRRNTRTKAEPTQTSSKRNAGNLDELLDQEKQEEAHQRKLAEDKRKAEEARQRKLAEDKRRREEAQRLAEQQQREADAQRDAARRKRQDTVNAGVFGAVLGFAAGNKNIGAAGLTQALTGEEADTGTLNQAYQSDLAEQKRQSDEEARRMDAEAARIERQHRLQEQAADRKVAEDTRQIDNYNRQVQQQRQQQADQQRQQNQQRQEQHQQDQRRQQEAARQAKLRPVTSCVTFRLDPRGSTYGYNHCNIKVQVRWHETQNGNGECVIEAGGRCTASTQAFGAHEYVACEYPAWPNIASGTCE